MAFNWAYDATSWHRFTIVVPVGATKASDILGYVDGNPITWSSSVLPNTLITTTSTGAATIGKIPTAAAGYAKAIVDEVRVMARAVSATEEATANANQNNPASFWTRGLPETIPSQSNSWANRDENYVPVLMGVSSADGKTPVPICVNSSNQLLIQST